MPILASDQGNERAGAGLELLRTDQMRRADDAAIAAGTPGTELMERAGAAVARAAAAMAEAATPILVFCGPGANGGDGFVAARLLSDAGRPVRVALLGDPARIAGDAAIALARWRGPIEKAEDASPERAGLIIDALFGAGLARDLDGAARRIVESVGGSGARILAVDLPSGVDGDTGAVRGAAARADRTVTFARRKPGHLLLPGRSLCGAIEVADIGVEAGHIAAAGAGALFANGPALWRAALPAPDPAGHKYGRGHLTVIAGGIEGVGAPRLSARAGLRIGAGLVAVAAPAEAMAAHAARGPDALMLRRADDGLAVRRLLADPRRNAAVIGPALGLDRSARLKLDAVLAADAACVLDADALTLLDGDAGPVRRAAGRRPIVLTPHEGEFARLFGKLPQDADIPIQQSKLDRALAAARVSGAVVVLKGPDTVVAAPDGRAAINENAPPWLATAGTGDVLAGLVGGLLAQGAPAWEAACAAVWLHGAAAEAVGRGLIADDLPDAAAKALAMLTEGTQPARRP